MNKLNTVQVIMSTYNGAKVVERQIESIVNQKDVDINILIRDDGSKDNTKDVLSKLSLEYPNKIKIIYGENEGWRKSFIDALFLTGDYDYYCFSDQDDLWLEDKVSKEIEALKDKSDKPLLAQCNAFTSNEKLEIEDPVEYKILNIPNYKFAIATECFHGCTMLWNKKMMDIIKQYKPKEEIAHDYWVGLLSYLFGEVVFVDDSLLHHIRYGNNASSDGDVNKGRLNRIKTFFKKGSAYINPTNNLIDGYSKYLPAKTLEFLNKIKNYKSNYKDKIYILRDREFVRPSKESTLLFRANILFDKY